MMQKWFLLVLGGACGTAGRYLLGGAVYRWLGTGFPYGTLAVNTLGCLAAGFLATLTDQKFLLKPEARVFWMVGLLGAFTTFSSLIYESWRLLQDGELLRLSEDLPILIEIVDREEKIQAFLPQLDAMIQDGLVTLEKAEVLLYRARNLSP